MAYTQIDKIYKNKDIAFKLNTLLPKNLSILSKKYHFKLIHISTDQLFDGKKKTYYENCSPTPINLYAKQKAQAENYIKKNSSNYLILRTNFFGMSTSKNKSFDIIYDSLSKNKQLLFYSDIYFNPIYVGDLVLIIYKLIKINAKGTFNISSDKKISKFDFAKMICDLFQFPHSNIISLEYKNDKIFKEKRPKNMFISNKKMKSKLSMKNISVLIGLKKIKKIIERQDKFVT